MAAPSEAAHHVAERLTADGAHEVPPAQTISELRAPITVMT
jgi:hypothetical protein